MTKALVGEFLYDHIFSDPFGKCQGTWSLAEMVGVCLVLEERAKGNVFLGGCTTFYSCPNGEHSSSFVITSPVLSDVLT